MAWPTMDEPVTHRCGRDPLEKGKHTATVLSKEKDKPTASTAWAQLLELNVRVSRVLDYTRENKSYSDPHLDIKNGQFNCVDSLSNLDSRYVLNSSYESLMDLQGLRS